MEPLANIDPWIALGVAAATALTDAGCVLYTSSVARQRDLAAANWGALTYMLSAFAVISFTSNWTYVAFAALGSWIGGYATMKYLRWRRARDPQEAAAAAAPALSPQPIAPTPLPAGPRLAA
jgi:hypothetical protein